MAKITVQNTIVTMIKKEEADYLSLTKILPSNLPAGSQKERLVKLNQIAIRQMQLLEDIHTKKYLK